MVSDTYLKVREILKRSLDILAADGKITTGENGILHKNLLTKPYSRAQPVRWAGTQLR